MNAFRTSPTISAPIGRRGQAFAYITRQMNHSRMEPHIAACTGHDQALIARPAFSETVICKRGNVLLGISI